MAEGKARIEASLEGASQVASEARRIEGSLAGAGSKIETKLGGALQTVGSKLVDLAKGGLQAAGIFQAISLAKAVEDVRALDEVTGKLAAKTGASSTQLQGAFQKLEQRILQGSQAQAEFAKSLGGLTYDTAGAIEALDGLGQHALASGRDLADELPLAKALRSMGVEGRDSAGELERVRAIAEKLGTAGGHLALQDSLGRLDSLLQGVNTQTDQARGRLEALMGVLGKGQKTPERADQVRAATLGMLKSRALDIERATGRKVLDDNGELIDPTQNLKDLRALSARRHGGRKGEMRAALINTYGQEAGLAILRGGFEQVDELSGLKGDGKTAAEAARAKEDPAAKRKAKELAKQSGLRELGRGLQAVDDALTDTLGAKGAAATEAGLGLMTLGGTTKLGTALTTGKTAVAGGSALPVAAGLAMAAPALAVLTEVGEDTETTGRKDRASKAKTFGAELARRAQERGGFDPADFAPEKGQGREAMVEMLKILDSRKDQLAPDFAQQVAAALASELRRAPIQVKQEKPANESGGN